MHLPCDSLVATSGNGAPWRIVTAGQTPCLSCGAAVEASCSAAGNAAACCRQEGNGCSDLGLDAANAGGGIGAECSIGGQMVCSACDDPSLTPTTARVGRFVSVGRTMSHSAAIDYCEEMHQSLASVHSWEEQQQAASACQAYASDQDDQPFSCWLGFIDLGQEGGFVWLDGSSVEYVHWSPGEPNESRTATRDGEDGKTLKPSLDRMQTILKEHYCSGGDGLPGVARELGRVERRRRIGRLLRLSDMRDAHSSPGPRGAAQLGHRYDPLLSHPRVRRPYRRHQLSGR